MKKQKRRSISVRGDIYDKVHSFCQEENMSMSSFVEERILKYLETSKEPGGSPMTPEVQQQAMPDKPATSYKPATPPPPRTSHIQSVAELSDEQLIAEMKQHFTF